MKFIICCLLVKLTGNCLKWLMAKIIFFVPLWNLLTLFFEILKFLKICNNATVIVKKRYWLMEKTHILLHERNLTKKFSKQFFYTAVCYRKHTNFRILFQSIGTILRNWTLAIHLVNESIKSLRLNEIDWSAGCSFDTLFFLIFVHSVPNDNGILSAIQEML